MNWKLLGGIGLTGVFLYLFGSIIQAIFLIPTISGWLAPLGIGKHFVFALAIPVFFWFNSALGNIFSLRKANRTMGLVMMLGFFGVLSLLQGFQTHGDRFDRETGTPNYSYSNDGSGVKIRSADTKYDPETGLKTVPLTPEALKGIEAAKRESWKKGGLNEMSDMYKSLSQ